MKRGWKKGTKSWVLRKNSIGKEVRLVDDLTVESKNKAHAVSFKRRAALIIPGKSCGSRSIDRRVCQDYAMKICGKDENFFKTHVLHHEVDGTRMYVDKALHQSKRHLGYGYILAQEQRKMLGLI